MKRYAYIVVVQSDASIYPWKPVRFVQRLVEASDDEEAASVARQQLNDEHEMPHWGEFLDDLVVRLD